MNLEELAHHRDEYMNKEDIENFEKLHSQLLGTYEEISLLSKKNPNDAMNKFKLKFINQLLVLSNNFLKERYKPFDDFNSFDEDEIPQNGDVVFIISQYLKCLESYKLDHVIQKRGGISWFWKIPGEENDNVDEKGFIYIRTSKPQIYG